MVACTHARPRPRTQVLLSSARPLSCLPVSCRHRWHNNHGHILPKRTNNVINSLTHSRGGGGGYSRNSCVMNEHVLRCWWDIYRTPLHFTRDIIMGPTTLYTYVIRVKIKMVFNANRGFKTTVKIHLVFSQIIPEPKMARG